MSPTITIDEIPVVTILVDALQNIMFCNAASKCVLGYEKEELLGKHIDCLIPSRCLDEHKKHVSKYMDKPVCCPLGVGRDLHALCKDGHEKCVEISLVPITVENAQYILVVMIDIEVRKLLAQIKDTALTLVSKKECLLEDLENG